MQNSPTDPREAVYAALEYALAVGRDEISDNVTITDLGAQSIDYLDIQFTVEKGVGFEIRNFRERLHAVAQDKYRSMPNTPARILELIEKGPNAY